MVTWRKPVVLAVSVLVLLLTAVQASAVPTSLRLFDSNLGMAGNRIENLGNVTLSGNMGLTGAKVGINTSNPSFALEVVGSAQVDTELRTPTISTNGVSNTLTLSGADLGTGGNAVLIKNRETTSGGNILQLQNGTGTAEVTVTDDGQVGIGTTGPGFPFEVVAGGDGMNVLSDQDTSTSEMLFVTKGRGAGSAVNGDAGRLVFRVENSVGDFEKMASVEGIASDVTDTSEDGELAFYTRSAGTSLTEAVRVDNTGNVLIQNGKLGINATSPASAIHMRGNSIGRVAITYEFTDTSQTRFVRWVDSGGTEMAWLAAENMDGAGNGTIDFNGKGNVDFSLTDANLGIGTRSPSDELHVGSTSPAIRLEDTGTSSGYVIQSDAGKIHFKQNTETGSSTMTLTGGGNVGIGTTNPVDLLHVEKDSGTDAQVAIFQNIGTAGMAVELRAASGTNSLLRFMEGSTRRYDIKYQGGNNRFTLASEDIDGAGTQGDIIRIPDSQVDVDFNGAVNTNAFDYAEWMEKNNPDAELEPGDLVAVRDRTVTRETEGAEILMVVSTDPGSVGGNAPFDMNETERNNYYADRTRIAFTGQVPVKVVGEAEEGDYLLPSGQDDGTAKAVSGSDVTFTAFRKSAGRVLEEFSVPDNAPDRMKPVYQDMIEQAEHSDYQLYWAMIGNR